MANDFGLDYQPRVIVFVEGYTEELILPEFFKWSCGGMPEHFGIEFMNFEGVDKLLSTSRTTDDLKRLIYKIQNEIRDKAVPERYIEELSTLIKELSNMGIVISNLTSFISYNLEKWQMVPFFISDNEGNIKHFLEAEKPIKYRDINYNVPTNWRFLWGIDNGNKPFRGSSFELANYNNKEIALAVGSVIGKPVECDQVESLRDNGAGINKIDEDKFFGKNKIKINELLCNNLLEKLNKSNDKSLMERPMFRAIQKIYEIASLNHPPVDRRIETENRRRIIEMLEN